MIQQVRYFFKLILAVAVIITAAALTTGCAFILEGSTQSVNVHCIPNADVSVLVDGDRIPFANGTLSLTKARETHFVTFTKDGYQPSTIAFDREINPFWPVADLIWGPAFPLAWLIDWQTGALYRIVPRDIHVIMRKTKGENQ